MAVGVHGACLLAGPCVLVGTQVAEAVVCDHHRREGGRRNQGVGAHDVPRRDEAHQSVGEEACGDLPQSLAVEVCGDLPHREASQS